MVDKNKRIGILGGSFNPPHMGHIHISEVAMKALGLDAVWWLVTPQNPLKSSVGITSFEKRVQMSRDITKGHTDIIVTDIENSFETQYSYDSIVEIKKLYPDADLVWIAGMDSAHNFHLWHKWQDILDEICVIFINRPNGNECETEPLPIKNVAHQNNITLHIDDKAKRPILDSNVTYWLFDNKTMDVSSTEIRSIAL